MRGCTLCGNTPVLYRKEHEGVVLGKKCFLTSVESKVRRTIVGEKMLESNDIVAVALSGGKDSVALLRILHKIEKRRPNARLVAITIE